MATTVADRALLDTNVLLAATDETRTGHTRALQALDDWPAAGATLYTSGQILREYLCVATRPLGQNGLGFDRLDAIENVRILRTRLRELSEDSKVSDRLLDLLTTVECSGKQVHGANVVATMLVHGIGTIVTSNLSDFARFDTHIRVVEL